MMKESDGENVLVYISRVGAPGLCLEAVPVSGIRIEARFCWKYDEQRGLINTGSHHGYATVEFHLDESCFGQIYPIQDSD